MSDLANSCEYLTIEKLCSAVLESERAKANRQIRCRNDEKTTCCYICLSRRQCTISCTFLGKIENTAPVPSEKTETENTFDNIENTQEPQTGNASVIYCSLCKLEMSQTRATFRITGWKGPHPKLSDDELGKSGEDLLPVIVYLCSKCGKIDFRADIQPNKN